MKYLNDFTENETRWLSGEFTWGRRHLDSQTYPCYSFAGSFSQVIDAPPLFSYFVSPDDENFLGVSPLGGSPVIGHVLGTNETLDFYDYDLMDDVREVFGPALIGLSVLCNPNSVDALALYESDIPESSFLDDSKMHNTVALLSLSLLSPRRRQA